MNKDPLLFINRGTTLNVTTVAGADAGGPSTYTGEPRQNKRAKDTTSGSWLTLKAISIPTTSSPNSTSYWMANTRRALH